MSSNSNIQNGSIENRIPDLAASILPASSGNERSGKQVYSVPSSTASVLFPYHQNISETGNTVASCDVKEGKK